MVALFMDASKSPFDDADHSSKTEPASDPSSATAIFGTITPRSAASPDDDLLKSLMGPQSSPASPAEPQKSTASAKTEPWTPVAPPSTATQPMPSTGSGGFTDIFESLQNTAPVSSPTSVTSPAASTPPGPAPKAPADLANVFTQVVVEKTSFTMTPPPPAAPNAGEFTQLLQTLSASTPKTDPQPPAPASPPPTAGSPGTFTEMFNAIS